MQARRLPAARGAFWFFEGIRLFRRNPPLITALTLVYLLIVQILTVALPGVGPILLPLLLPALPAVAVPLWLGRRLGGHSGDSYGACVEWSQAVGLLLCALVLSAPALRAGLMAAG